MPFESEVATKGWARKALTGCCLLVFVAAGIFATIDVVDQQPVEDLSAAHTLNAAVVSTIGAKSFIECVQSTYLPAADGCVTYHGPDQLAIGFGPPNSAQMRIYSMDRMFSSLGYGQALSGSAHTQAAESSALERADLWTEVPMAHSEVVSEVQSVVFSSIDLLRTFRGTLTQKGSEYRITSPNGALTAWATVQRGFVTSVTTREELSKGKWTTRETSLSKFNGAPSFQLPKPQTIVARVHGDGCAEQVIVPQCL